MTEKPLGDVTIREMAFASEAFRDVCLAMLETTTTMATNDCKDMADHILRRIFVNGDAMKYDHGKEQPMTAEQIFSMG